MSTKLSLKEALERQGATPTAPRGHSDSQTVGVVLSVVSPIERPVDFIRLLVDGGVSMKRARMLLDRLSAKQLVAVEIDADKTESILHEMPKLGVKAARLRIPQADPKTIREKQGLSQPEFACLFGVDVDTLKNWEQGRNIPDGPARVLLSVIDHCPHAVINARAGTSIQGFIGFHDSGCRFAEIIEYPFEFHVGTWNPGYRVTYGIGKSMRRKGPTA